MDFLFLSPTSATLTILSLLLLTYFLLLKLRNATKRGKSPPVAGGAWPLIGHFHIFGRSSHLAHITLASMADKYGPIFTIKLGQNPVLVVSSSEMARECLHTNDKIFASRPHLVAGEHMAYDNATFGFAPYGPYWREMRKIATIELLSNHRINSFEHIIEDELKASTRRIHYCGLKRMKKQTHQMLGAVCGGRCNAMVKEAI
ncbi:Cytochrome P450 [Dillenia turbinata]|uniref:Cytochrome P450 n=1 Tax=Dillenia turbinata TaxID=194707 RepID=A0AAN8ZFA8_9MAGN